YIFYLSPEGLSKFISPIRSLQLDSPSCCLMFIGQPLLRLDPGTRLVERQGSNLGDPIAGTQIACP
ncbi:hypothetical protein, partial [Brevibacterium senegalense]|uniref:hypothetical protein n=1 Tax=Brevibacterium senegalense TaxID=1033736 RepID=UPI001C54F446